MIEELKRIAREAGGVIQEGFYAAKEVEHKGVVDLVTRYDRRTEEVARELLERAFPGVALVGEEFGGEARSGVAIYIDPIDGTTNFVHGIPHTALSIGVWEEDAYLGGVVYNPIFDEFFWAWRGQGAWCNDKRLLVSQTNDLQQALVATGFPYTKAQRGDDLAWVIERLRRVLPATRDVRRLGAASLDLCYLAQGKFDIFYEINLKSWDVAAGIAILLEAGGKASDLAGSASGVDDGVIVASNGLLHREFLELLR
ncbi:MAG: inositol monophosphatase [Campylobacterales bacterium]